MSGLSVEDREELLANLVDDPMWIDADGQPLGYLEQRELLIGDHLKRQVATVEAIVARRVRAALTEAADQIRDKCPGDHLAKPCTSCRGAAQIVRALIPSQ